MVTARPTTLARSAAPPAPSLPPGRPRDPQIDARVLAATRELLEDVGWDDTSIRAIAERAGVSRPAITRRWPSKAHLVLDAILGAAPDLDRFDGVDRSGWVRAVVEGSVELFGRPDVRAAVPGLLAALRDHDDIRRVLWQGFTGPATERFLRARGPQAHRPAAATDGAAEAAAEAQAVIVAAAGAALVLSLVADPEIDTGAMAERIGALLTGIVKAPPG